MSKAAATTFVDLATPRYCICCEDIIVGADGNCSFIKLFDQLNASDLPVMARRFMMALEFTRNSEYPPEVIKNANPELIVAIQNPTGKRVTCPPIFPFADIDVTKVGSTFRVFCDLSNIVYAYYGVYTFQIIVKMPEQSEVEIFRKTLVVAGGETKPGEPAESTKSSAGKGIKAK